MSTLREAIHHARTGGTAYCGSKQIRFLTFAEAEPFILEQCSSRRVARDENGAVIEKDKKIVVETFANPRFKLSRLGLFNVGQNPPVPFEPTDDDIYLPVELDEEGKEKPRVLRTDWSITSSPPEPVAPEVVDEVLHETIPETLGELHRE